MMKRAAFFALSLCFGLLVAPGLAVNVAEDLGEDAWANAIEDADPVGEADAHYEPRCLIMPCTCYVDHSPYTYHCHT